MQLTCSFDAVNLLMHCALQFQLSLISLYIPEGTMLGVVTLRGEGQYLQRPAHQGRGHVGVHVRALGVCGLHLRQQLAHLHVVLGR